MTHFGITINGVPVYEIVADSNDTIDVRVDQPTVVLGWVSSYTEHDARRKAGYTLPEWEKLTPYERAQEVALYRISATLNYVRSKADSGAGRWHLKNLALKSS